MKKYVVIFLLIFSLCFGLAYYTLSLAPMLSGSFGDDSLQVSQGRLLAERMRRNERENNNGKLTPENLTNVAKWMEKGANKTQFSFLVNQYGLTLSFTKKIRALFPLYINVVCVYSNYQNHLYGEGCTLGRINIDNSKVEDLLFWLMKDDTAKVLSYILKASRIEGNGLALGSPKPSDESIADNNQLEHTTPHPSAVNTVAELNKPYSEKELLSKRHLRLIGGFKIPRVKHKGRPYSSMYLDHLPGSGRWVMGHPDGLVIELLEPNFIGTGAQDSWPELTESHRVKAMYNIEKLGPTGVLYLDENNVLVSGRKSYRSGFEAEWMAKVNLRSSAEVRFKITAKSNEENDNFHLMQALGGGFMRITDKKWSIDNLDGAGFLLGRGGYDVLGSPLGPALGLWNGTDETPSFLLDFPMSTPARRDPFYTYPAIDKNTYRKARLPIWKMPDEDGGYWQAGDVGGIAFISHPHVKGVVVTHNYGRGVHDYRSQGDMGSGPYFLVASPKTFYSEKGKDDRGNHNREEGNSAYPAGLVVRGAQVYDPLHLKEAYLRDVKPYEAEGKSFDWPKEGLAWANNEKLYTKLGSSLWDNERQLLWVVFGHYSQTYVAAYRIEVTGDSKPPKYDIPSQWIKDFENAKLSEIRN